MQDDLSINDISTYCKTNKGVEIIHFSPPNMLLEIVMWIKSSPFQAKILPINVEEDTHFVLV